MYLIPQEYAAFGIPDATEAQVLAASRRIDAELGRPEGLLYGTDEDGLPAYMLGLSATASYTLDAPVTAGTLLITITNAKFTTARVGDVAIIDREGTCEAVTVTAASGNTLTLSSLSYDHPAGATVEFGLVLTDERLPLRGGYRFPLRRPVARILSVSSREYGYGFRTLLNAAGIYSNTPANQWNPLDMGGFDLDGDTLDLYPGVDRCEAFRARIRYVAGWSEETLPALIKQAVAELVASQNNASDLPAGVKTLKAGDSTITRFDNDNNSGVSSHAKALLAPFRTYRLG